MIEFVYFDLGKVLFDFDYTRLTDQIIQKSKLDKHQLASMLWDDTLIVRYETGEFSTEEFLSLIKRRFALEETLASIKEAWLDIFDPLSENLAAATETLEKTRVGVLSNTSPSHFEYLSTLHPFLRDQRIVPILSYEKRVRKPDEAIFRQAMRSAEVPSQNILYFDDLQDNVDAAKRLGWKAYQVTPELSLRQVLIAHGIL
ncbi:MAG: HAD family hydrolase [Puniceicoccaceae bacterium]